MKSESIWGIAQRSEADHAANVAGMNFWRKLMEAARAGDRAIVRFRRDFDICDYVDGDWVE